MTAYYVLASDPLAAWGQAAAIYLMIGVFVSTLVGLALVLGLLFGFSWLRVKIELIKKLRPFVDSVNVTAEASLKQEPVPASAPDNKIVRTVAQLPGKVTSLDDKVNQGSDKVAHAVIEFHGRTEMAKTVLKQLFLPGLNKASKDRPFVEPGELSPGYQAVTRQTEPVSPEAGDGYSRSFDAKNAEALRNAPAR